MSSNRLMYDRCAYATEIKESIDPLEYNLFLGKFENCKTCPVGDFPNVLPFGPKTMVESELLGLTRENSKCPGKKYQANSGFKDCVPLSAARMCESIYYITPNNLEKPTSNMINSKNLGINFCPAKKTIEEFKNKCDTNCTKCIHNNYNKFNTCYNDLKKYPKYNELEKKLSKINNEHDHEYYNIAQQILDFSYEKCGNLKNNLDKCYNN